MVNKSTSDDIRSDDIENPTTSESSGQQVNIRRHLQSDDIKDPTTSVKAKSDDIKKSDDVRSTKSQHQTTSTKARSDDIKTYSDQRSSEEEDQDQEVIRIILFHYTTISGFVIHTTKKFRQQGRKTKCI